MFCFRKHDYENFLCTLLLPSNIRTTAFAVRAFNIEVSRIQDTVSNEQIGLMRMKFWEDAVDRIYTGQVPNQPVAKELYRVRIIYFFKIVKIITLLLYLSIHFGLANQTL